MELLYIAAGIFLLWKIGDYCDRKVRKPPIRQLVEEFLYFDYDYSFVGGSFKKQFRLAENKSKYKVTLNGMPDGAILIRYLGRRGGARFTEEELGHLLVTENS